MNFVLLQWIQVDDPTLGLYYLEDAIGPTLFLEAKDVDPTTYTEKKVMYVFLKKNIILDPKIIYKDRYNIEYTRVPKETVQTYHFGGLPLYDAIGQTRTIAPEPSILSQPQEESRPTTMENGKKPTSATHKTPLPTNTMKVGAGLGMNGGD